MDAHFDGNVSGQNAKYVKMPLSHNFGTDFADPKIWLYRLDLKFRSNSFIFNTNWAVLKLYSWYDNKLKRIRFGKSWFTPVECDKLLSSVFYLRFGWTQLPKFFIPIHYQMELW